MERLTLTQPVSMGGPTHVHVWGEGSCRWRNESDLLLEVMTSLWIRSKDLEQEAVTAAKDEEVGLYFAFGSSKNHSVCTGSRKTHQPFEVRISCKAVQWRPYFLFCFVSPLFRCVSFINRPINKTFRGDRTLSKGKWKCSQLFRSFSSSFEIRSIDWWTAVPSCCCT